MKEYEFVYPHLYVPPRSDHWSCSNERSWTDLEIEEFLEKECFGQDVLRPCGTQVLLKEPFAEKKTAAGIIIPEEVLAAKMSDCTIGRILDFGPDAFQDKKRYPSGPYCNRGDLVIYHRYERRKVTLKIDGKELKLFTCYDDKILCKIKDQSFLESTLLG